MTRQRPSIDLRAQCDCGAVTLHARGQVISMFLCSCENCQRVSGGGHSSVALLAAADVAVTGPVKSHIRPADSGASFTRCFCPDCGTTVYAYSSRAPDIRILPVGLFAGHNDWFEPGQLIFARNQAGWDAVADHLPRHQTYRGAQP